MTTQLFAWHNEPKLKSAVLARAREDRQMDRLVQGIYWEHGRGCHLGCLTRVSENWHDAAHRMFGLDLRVCYWLEGVFEGLPKDDCGQWVTDSIEAIPVGADLSLAHHHLAIWLLSGEAGLLSIVDVNRAAIEQTLALHRRAANGEAVSEQEWSAARSAAWSAAESARSAAESARSAAESARSAAESAAWSAAWSAWCAAESAAESAAWCAAESAAWSAAESARSAAWSAAESAARSAAWKEIAAKSLEIFRNSPVVQSTEPITESVQAELCGAGIWCDESLEGRV